MVNSVGKKTGVGFGFFQHDTDAKIVMLLLMALEHYLHAGQVEGNTSAIRASAIFEWGSRTSTRVVLKLNSRCSS
jgi:hypothetical protein